jgi:hypothetical protein
MNVINSCVRSRYSLSFRDLKSLENLRNIFFQHCKLSSHFSNHGRSSIVANQLNRSQKIYRTMSIPPSRSCSPTFNSREQSVEMLASSMILFSISENAPVANTGYHSRLSSPSDSSPNGWGTSMSRKSYKNDLASLASACPMDAQPQKTSSMQCGDAWGYFSDRE